MFTFLFAMRSFFSLCLNSFNNLWYHAVFIIEFCRKLVSKYTGCLTESSLGLNSIVSQPACSSKTNQTCSKSEIKYLLNVSPGLITLINGSKTKSIFRHFSTAFYNINIRTEYQLLFRKQDVAFVQTLLISFREG